MSSPEIQTNLQLQTFVLALLSDQQPPRRQEDWNGLVRFVTEEHLQGLIYRKVRNRTDVPEAVMRFLERAYLVTLAANTVKVEYIRELDRHLDAAGVTALILKGGALLETVYADPGLRPMEDIDLLVRPKDLALLKSILEQCGYRPDPGMAAMFRKNDVWIDVHTSLMHTGRIRSRSALLPMDGEPVFQETVPWGQGCSGVRRPDDARHVIFMAHHMIKHSFSKLIWLVDLHAVVRDRDEQFWEDLNRKAVRYGQAKPLAFVFFLLERLFHFLPPLETVFHPAAGMVSTFERYLLNFRVRSRPLGDLGFLLWINCLNSRRDRWRLMAETVFPDAELLKREYPQARGLSRPRLLIFRFRQVMRRFRQNLRAMAGSIMRR